MIPEHMTWYGFVVNGVNYLGGCQTRFGVYPYCESIRATSADAHRAVFCTAACRLVQSDHFILHPLASGMVSVPLPTSMTLSLGWICMRV